MTWNDDKDIYELLNDIEFDINDEIEMPMNDIEKQRLKRRVKKSIGKAKRKKGLSRQYKLIIAMIAFLMIGTLISPKGREAIAAIKNKLFFNAGTGLVSTTEELYVLKEPITIKMANEDIIIKRVMAREGSLEIGIWVNGDDNINFTKKDYHNELKDKVYIRTKDGKIIKSTREAIGSGGGYTFINTFFETKEALREFSLVLNDYEKEINLVRAEEKNSYDEISGNDTDNNTLIGANKYNIEKDTYIAFWSEEETRQNGAYYIGYNKDNIKATGENSGEIYPLEPSNFDGSSKEFYVGKAVEEPLKIDISEVEMSYRLKNPLKMRLPIPKKGERIYIGEEVFIKDLNEKVFLKSIERTEEGIEITVDVGKYKRKDSLISIMSISRRGWCIGSSLDDTEIKMGVDYEDLSIKEKLTNKLDAEIMDISIIRHGNWTFTVK